MSLSIRKVLKPPAVILFTFGAVVALALGLGRVFGFWEPPSPEGRTEEEQRELRARQRIVQKVIASMGEKNLLILPGPAPAGVAFGSGSVMTLTPQDADAIRRHCPAVKDVAVIVRARTEVKFGDKNWVPLFIYGTTPSYLDIREWKDLEEGKPFSDEDVQKKARVCLVGQTIKSELFKGQSPLEREVRIQNVAFQVVGVLKARGANVMGLDQDDVVLAPWTTIKARVSGNQGNTPPEKTTTPATVKAGGLDTLYPKVDPLDTYPAEKALLANIDQILVGAKSSDDVKPANRQITDLLRQRHHIKPGQPDDFSVRDLTEIIRALRSSPAKEPPPEPIARMVHYSGRVQGVGFRATAVEIANGFPVTGWVKNLDDGRVQLLVEGPEDPVKKFLSAIRMHWGKNIEKEQVEEKKASGEFKDFSIRRQR
jgi:acylphosphatase